MEQKGKLTIGRTMMQALKYMRLVIRHVSGSSNVEISPVATAMIE